MSEYVVNGVLLNVPDYEPEVGEFLRDLEAHEREHDRIRTKYGDLARFLPKHACCEIRKTVAPVKARG